MLFIGITGGVGAGKSAILSYLKDHYRTRVMLADEIAHDLMEPGTECYAQLRELFREDHIFLSDGRIDRPGMAKVIFSDDGKRDALNDIVHPAVKKYVIEQAALERQRKALDFIVLEAALLIEEQYDKVCDELWYIFTTVENRKKRLKASRGYSEEKCQSIIDSQLSEDIYRKYCQVVIDNNGTPEMAFSQIQEALRERGIIPAKREF